MGKVIDLTGQRFGEWTVIERTVNPKIPNRTHYRCQCSCGTIRSVDAANLRYQKSTNCGHKSGKPQERHGLFHLPEYSVWQDMIYRCTRQTHRQWSDYGGRGICVYQPWIDSFAQFYKDVGPRPSYKHSLDRFPNNDGNYEPGNVRWATQSQQLRNTRYTRWIEFRGRRMVLKDWARELGIYPGQLGRRIDKYGIEVALSAPKAKGCKDLSKLVKG